MNCYQVCENTHLQVNDNIATAADGYFCYSERFASEQEAGAAAERVARTVRSEKDKSVYDIAVIEVNSGEVRLVITLE
jgi:hypothetical protein